MSSLVHSDLRRLILHQPVSWSSGYDFPLTIASSKCSGKVLGSIPRETILFVFSSSEEEFFFFGCVIEGGDELGWRRYSGPTANGGYAFFFGGKRKTLLDIVNVEWGRKVE